MGYGTRLMVSLLAAMLILTIPLAIGGVETDVTALIERGPIRINSDAEFMAMAIEETWPGTGTSDDPYLIAGYEINGTGVSTGFYVGNTSVFFIFESNDIYHIKDDIAKFGPWVNGIELKNVANALIRDNTITHSVSGIQIVDSERIQIDKNSIGDDDWNHLTGIWILGSNGIVLNNNRIPKNEESAIKIIESSDLQITGNQIFSNIVDFPCCEPMGNGIALINGENISVWHNVFRDNVKHIAGVAGEYRWDLGYPEGGNFWDDYTGIYVYSGPGQDQPGSDGIGDTPNQVPGGQDGYPLMSPNYTVPDTPITEPPPASSDPDEPPPTGSESIDCSAEDLLANLSALDNVLTQGALICTSKGRILVGLDARANLTVNNFERYVLNGFYDGLIFHRVIDGFVIQGGGFGPGMVEKTPTYPPISLETHEYLRHENGVISMARTNDPNSATSQFFICDGPQYNLDGQYAVFGLVLAGMDVVRAISAVQTGTSGGYWDVPTEEIVIERVVWIEELANRTGETSTGVEEPQDPIGENEEPSGNPEVLTDTLVLKVSSVETNHQYLLTVTSQLTGDFVENVAVEVLVAPDTGVAIGIFNVSPGIFLVTATLEEDVSGPWTLTYSVSAPGKGNDTATHIIEVQKDGEGGRLPFVGLPLMALIIMLIFATLVGVRCRP